MIMISLSSNPAVCQVCQQKGVQSDLSFAFFACCKFEPFGTLPLFISCLLLPASKCLFPLITSVQKFHNSLLQALHAINTPRTARTRLLLSDKLPQSHCQQRSLCHARVRGPTVAPSQVGPCRPSGGAMRCRQSPPAAAWMPFCSPSHLFWKMDEQTMTA